MRLPNRTRWIGWAVAACLALTVGTGSAPLWAVEPLPIGGDFPAAAAALELTNTDGEAVRLGDLWKPQGLLVVFTSNSCPYSMDWRDRLPRLGKLGDELEIGLAVVNSNARKRRAADSLEAMKTQREEHFPTVAYHVDVESRLADLLGAARTPEVFLFDGDKKLVYHGQIDDVSGPIEKVERHFLRDAMQGLALGEAIPEATAPLGCAILRPRKRRPKPGS